jgi:hypothetical protein
MIPGVGGQNPQPTPANPLQAAVDAGGGAFLQADQTLRGAGLSADQAKQLAGALTQPGGNPLLQGAIGAEMPSIAQYGQAFSAAEGQIGALPGLYDTLSSQANLSSWLQSEQLGNQATGNQLQQQNVAQQLGISQGQNQLQNQLAGIQQGQLSYNLGLAQDQARSQGAISGTLNTQGYQQKQGQLQEAYDVSSAELQNQLAGENLGFKGQQLSAANQQAQLKNTAAALGISQNQLQAQLNAGMTQLGMQESAQQDQLFQQAAQAQAGEAQGLGAIFSNIGALTGGGPAMFKNVFPGLGQGGK